MPKVSGELANATAVASGFISIHLFKVLIERGVGLAPGSLTFKLENLQHTGSFKARGASRIF